MELKKQWGSKQALLIVLMLVIVSFSACSGNSEAEQDVAATQPPAGIENTSEDQIGQGETTFYFSIDDGENEIKNYTIHTDKKMLGEALLEIGIIEGEDMGDLGFSVKTVNGKTADFEKDGAYWGFFVEREYAPRGVDSEEIVDGGHYALSYIAGS